MNIILTTILQTNIRHKHLTTQLVAIISAVNADLPSTLLRINAIAAMNQNVKGVINVVNITDSLNPVDANPKIDTVSQNENANVGKNTVNVRNERKLLQRTVVNAL